MKEIGGYFGLEELMNDEYYKDLIPLNNARNALIYILKSKRIKKIYIPYYLCNEIRKILLKNKYEFEYYNVDNDFKPIFNKVLKEEYIYIVNYYGQLDNKIIIELKEKYKRIIIDNTHSFFQEPVEEVDTIYNCRKFFGVPDGAYLYTKSKNKIDLNIDISKDRMNHILGRYEGTANEYYNDFKNNDRDLENEDLKYMSKLTHNLLGAINYKNVIKKRTINYNYLHKNLNKYNKLKLNNHEGPFAYPLYINNGTEVRKKLEEKKIYIPTLWPNVLEDVSKDTLEYDYVENILPLPCDQRYSLGDMKYIINELKIYFK